MHKIIIKDKNLSVSYVCILMNLHSLCSDIELFRADRKDRDYMYDNYPYVYLHRK
jgi:hypothetical protein